ncbi:HlyB/MsbA family ABC transporter [Amylostereum chailletii]|nr:HlyB/MsbA family ABC transporter [Amylostereum chailletii]
MPGFRRRRQNRNKGSFDPNDAANIQHHSIGVWDLYVQRDPKLSWIPQSWKVEEYAELLNDAPYLWRTVQDISPTCWQPLVLYGLLTLALSLIPALSLWYSGQLLEIVQIAVEQRTVDKQRLFQIAGGRIACSFAQRILNRIQRKTSTSLNGRIRRYYSVHIFHSMARLDVPTYDDPVIARQLDSVIPSASGRTSIPWSAMVAVFNIASNALNLLSQLAVLTGVLRKQPDGPLLAILTAIKYFFSLGWGRHGGRLTASGVYAATTHDADFLRAEGLKRVASNGVHRKELVAANLAGYLTIEFERLVKRLGSRAGDFWSLHDEQVHSSVDFLGLTGQVLEELPQIVFTLRAVEYPMSIPVSVASLNLIQHSSTSFLHRVTSLINETENFAERLANLRKLYEARNIKNQVPDGAKPYPENAQSMRHGIALEFRNVSFKYPGAETFALSNVSFKVEPGQLCVIVGVNGSGKSTILKLIARIYDVAAGTILIDGQDIATLRLADLRRATAILFQDYTHFPLSIRDNIALGDPDTAHDTARVVEAARLGGATTIIERLPNGLDTYLERPVRDLYSGLPEGTQTLFGRTVSHAGVRHAMGGGGGGAGGNNMGLSGGQMQRLAVARTFMRSMPGDSEKVGLLLFDEPSASLDPTAEHDLFKRLRELRGDKTMVFSTHRFGNLTRHADLILYMDDSVVVEAGTHEQLLNAEGEYARLWKMQAQAFL